jgi:hypothetical protein
VLAERGLPHAYLTFEGEGHGFRRAENQLPCLTAELSAVPRGPPDEAGLALAYYIRAYVHFRAAQMP